MKRVVEIAPASKAELAKQALAKAGVDNFIKMGEKARSAVRTLDTIDRQLARVEGGIPTGIAANLEVTLRQIGQAVGMPTIQN